MPSIAQLILFCKRKTHFLHKNPAESPKASSRIYGNFDQMRPMIKMTSTITGSTQVIYRRIQLAIFMPLP